MRKFMPIFLLACLTLPYAPATVAGERGGYASRGRNRAPVDEELSEEDRAFFEWLRDDEGGDLLTPAERRAQDRIGRQYAGVPRLSRPVASRRNDRVTIVINESTSSTMQSKTDGKYESDIETGLESWFTLNGKSRGGDGKMRLPLATSTTRNHKGDSKSQDSSTFKTELSGQVLDVLPNGYLVVEARKTQMVNNDTRTIVAVGVVDPHSLDADNRVDHTDVIDLEFRMVGKGDIANDQRRGFLTRMFDRFKPF